MNQESSCIMECRKSETSVRTLAWVECSDYGVGGCGWVLVSDLEMGYKRTPNHIYNFKFLKMKRRMNIEKQSIGVVQVGEP